MTVIPQPAATLVIVKDSPQGPLVLMQQRSTQARFVGGAWVFPGGKVDIADSDPRWAQHCHRLTDNDASAQLGLSNGGLAYWIAAVRECFEEAGLLPVYGRGWLAPSDLNAWRQRMIDHTQSFTELCVGEGLILDTARIHYLSHWITPEPSPIRFDTRFFIMQAPEGQEPHHGLFEAVDTQWLTPETALQRHRQGQMTLILPTLITLQDMVGHTNCRTLIQHLVTSVKSRYGAGAKPLGMQ